jgi:hypothetical protein
MNLHAAVQSRGNAVEHRQRVTLVIRVFGPTNNRRGRPDQFGQLSLAETRLCAQSGNFPRNLIVSPSRLQASQSVRFISVITTVENFYRIAGWFSFGSRHDQPSFMRDNAGGKDVIVFVSVR